MKARNKPTGFLQTLLVIACTCCISLMALAGGIKTPDVSPHVDISHRADPPTRVDYGSQNAANSSSYDSSTTNTTGSYDANSGSTNIAGQGSYASTQNSGGGTYAHTNNFPNEVFSSKAPQQTTPGTSTLEGQHINNQGRVEPWTASYDSYGRQIGRTDYNAGNKTENIPDTHHHTREYNARYPEGKRTGDHIPGEYNKP